MTNPIDAAKALTPWWMMQIRRFDGIEIHSSRTDASGTDDSFNQPSQPAHAQCWSIFGHRADGTLERFESFTTQAEAREFAETMLRAWPHLKTYAVLD